ncbi:MAG TPA: choice-of-anchor A family protein [Humibacter sp.]|nr:choice-of-anchor A family protein [Humibacter sp.]
MALTRALGNPGAIRLAVAILLPAFAVTGILAVSPAAAHTTRYNPLAEYADWNVVSFGDTNIHAESEGPVASGGDLTFAGTNVGFKSSSAIALLTGGRVDYAGSAGSLQVNSSGSIKIGDLTGADALDTDQNNAKVNTEVVRAGAGYGSTPAVTSNHRQPATTVAAPGLFAATFSQAAADASSAAVAAAATGTCNAGEIIQPEISAGRASVSLHAGANYWNLTTDELSGLSQITFTGATTPSTQNPLIINVAGSGPVTISLNLAGARDPRGILFNLPDATSITQGGDSIDGSILAPKADYTKTSANLQGTAIVASADLGGSEEHYFPFGGFITDCVTATTPTPIPTQTPGTPVPTPGTPVPTPGTPVPTPTTPATVPTASPTTGTPSAATSKKPERSIDGAAPASAELAHTGSDVAVWIVLGTALLVAGGIITVVARGRRGKTRS